MDIATTSLITTSEIIDLVEKVASLNLGYLGISVTIITLLGGAFYLFNFRPLKDTIEKQEERSRKTEKEIENKFLELQDKQQSGFDDISSKIDTQVDEQIVEFKSAEEVLRKDIYQILKEQTDKNTALQETNKQEISIITKNQILASEKVILEKVNDIEKKLIGEVSRIDKSINSLTNNINDIKRRVKQLEVYKYSKEGKMGAIYGLIDLLKEDIDAKIDWRIIDDLENLEKNIKGIILSGNIIVGIEEQLSRIEGEGKYAILIKNVKNQYTQDKEK